MISEADIYERFKELEAIQIIDQMQGEYMGRLQAKGFTADWLRGRGFEHKRATNMVRRAIRKFEKE